MLKNANNPIPITLSPESNSWEIREGMYKLTWYQGEQISESVSQHSDDSIVDALETVAHKIRQEENQFPILWRHQET